MKAKILVLITQLQEAVTHYNKLASEARSHDDSMVYSGMVLAYERTIEKLEKIIK